MQIARPIVAANILAAFGYMFLGVFGLELAVPPSIAAPFWPAAGFAALIALRFGFVIIPGLVIGSFLCTLTSSELSGTPYGLMHFFLWGGIALATAVRATIGIVLARLLNVQNPLEDHMRGVFAMGAIASIPAAAIGSLSLWAVEFLPSEEILRSMLIWWIGDTIGTFAVWYAGSGILWAMSQRKSKWFVQLALPTGTCAIIVLASFISIRQATQKGLESDFKLHSETFATAIQGKIRSGMDRLTSIQAFYMGSDNVNHDEFNTFCKRTFPKYDIIQGLSWIPEIRGSQRLQHESTIQALGYANYTITQPSAAGLVPADDRDRYYAVSFTYPMEKNKAAHGLDVLSATTSSAYMRARATNQAVASPPIRLVQEQEQQLGTIIAIPIWGDRAISPKSWPVGYLALVLRLGDVVQNSLNNMTMHHIDVRLVTSDRVPQILFSTGRTDPANGLMYSTSLNIPGQTWMIECVPGAEWAIANQDWASYVLLLGGMILTGLLGMLLGNMVLAKDRIEIEVRAATSDLRKTNAALALSRDAAEAGSAAKGRFLATMSHEMRTPLNGVIGGLDLLLHSDLDDRQNNLAITAKDSGAALLALIDDILDLSRIEEGAVELRCDLSPALPIIEEAMRVVAENANQKGIDLWYQGPIELGSIAIDSIRFRQILINLLGNAVKFTEQGWVSLEAEQTPSGLRITVADSGIGISSEHITRIFDPFIQAEADTTRRFGGTGLGLAISKKLSEAMGGQLTATSIVGKGSRFTLVFPQAKGQNTLQKYEGFQFHGTLPRFRASLAAMVEKRQAAQFHIIHLDEAEPAFPANDETNNHIGLTRNRELVAANQNTLLKPLLPSDLLHLLKPHKQSTKKLEAMAHKPSRVLLTCRR